MKKILSCVLFVGFLTENVYASKNNDLLRTSSLSIDFEDWQSTNIDDENHHKESPISITEACKSPTMKQAALKALDAHDLGTAGDLLRDIFSNKLYSEKFDGAVTVKFISAATAVLSRPVSSANQHEIDAITDITESLNERSRMNSPRYTWLQGMYNSAITNKKISLRELSSIQKAMESMKRGDKYYSRLSPSLYHELTGHKSSK